MIKALEFKVSPTSNVAYLVEQYSAESFYPRLHFHQEIQISLIESGNGTAVLGYEPVKFRKGDVLIIGSKVPHVLKLSEDSREPAVVYSIYLNTQKLKLVTDTLVELDQVKKLIELKGCIKVPENIKIKRSIASIPEQSNYNGILALLDLLSQLNTIQNRQEINVLEWSSDYDERINKVMDHIYNHSDQTIRLEAVADISHMTVPAFCRYFKKYTGFSFISYLNEIKIRNACEMILSSNLTFSEISSQCGFNNLSNFNRQFLKIMGSTPSQYKKKVRIGI